MTPELSSDEYELDQQSWRSEKVSHLIDWAVKHGVLISSVYQALLPLSLSGGACISKPSEFGPYETIYVHHSCNLALALWAPKEKSLSLSESAGLSSTANLVICPTSPGHNDFLVPKHDKDKFKGSDEKFFLLWGKKMT